MAAFLSRQHAAADDLLGTSNAFSNADPLAAPDNAFIQPTKVLFNGGVLKAPALANRTLACINQWLQDAGAPAAQLLGDTDLDLAVASGASYYSYAKNGQGMRIRGGLASAYYVGIESTMPAIPGMEPPLEALCIAPFGMEEGSATDTSSAEFGLVGGRAGVFPFLWFAYTPS